MDLTRSRCVRGLSAAFLILSLSRSLAMSSISFSLLLNNFCQEAVSGYVNIVLQFAEIARRAFAILILLSMSRIQSSGLENNVWRNLLCAARSM
jgi:hypothetical protein